MSTRHLKELFNPSTIAVVGQGADQHLIARLVRHLVLGEPAGAVLPVCDGVRTLSGLLTYPRLEDLPQSPQLAIVTPPWVRLPALIDTLGQQGCKAVALVGEPALDPHEDGALISRIIAAAGANGLRLLGPDGFGFMVPGSGLNVSLSPRMPPTGHVAVLAQSAAVVRALLDWADSRQIGISHAIAMGQRLDVDSSDLLDYLALDGRTRAILLHVNRIHKPRKFMSAARIAARIKPVVVLKPYVHDPASTEDAIYDAAFRRAGVLRVRTLEQLLAAAETLATVKPVYGRRLAIMGNSRTVGLMAAESLRLHGGELAQFDETLQVHLRTLTPSHCGAGNPLDLGDYALPERYREALHSLLDTPGVDAVLVAHATTGSDSDTAAAQAVADVARSARRLVLTSWVGGDSVIRARQVLSDAGLATYASPNDAARVFTRIAQYSVNLELLMATPPSLPEAFAPDTDRARAIIAGALERGEGPMTITDARALLTAYGIDVLTAIPARTPDEAADAAERLGEPVALKLLSPDIPRRADFGATRVGLVGADAVREAAVAMLARVGQLAPQAQLTGFVVQPVRTRGQAYELALGMQLSEGFGPVIRFGHGGMDAEAIADHAFALPPLNMRLAMELIDRTRIARLVAASPGRPAAMDDLALTLIKLAQLVIDFAEVSAVDLDPVWLGDDGVLAINGRVTLARAAPGDAGRRLAIRPYPKELESAMCLADGRAVLLRPIVPEDEPALQAMVRRMPLEDLRLRFFQPIRELSHAMAARLTQLDYDREMAFAIADPGLPGTTDIHAVARMSVLPALDRGEYAIIVDRAMAGRGLGTLLMQRIIDYARERGVKQLFGDVLRENDNMLRLNRKLGFTVTPDVDDPSIMRVRLDL